MGSELRESPHIEIIYDKESKLYMCEGKPYTGHIKEEKYDTVSEIWYEDGLVHRDRFPVTPAAIYHYKGMDATDIHYYKHGKLHREDGGPAHINDCKSNGICIEEWYVDDVRHRTDGGPAMKYRHRNTTPEEQLKYAREGRPTDQNEYYVEGKLHCLNGPAKVERYRTEQWYEDGKWIREKAIFYDPFEHKWTGFGNEVVIPSYDHSAKWD